jgi:hypothetical protein
MESDRLTAQSTETLCAMANITDIVFKVIHEVAGNDISSTINGSKVSREVLTGLIQTRVRNHKLV